MPDSYKKIEAPIASGGFFGSGVGVNDIVQGATGPKGDTGNTGAQGAQGVQGIQGSQGIQGNDGDKDKTVYLYDAGSSTPSAIAAGAGFNTSTGAAADTGTWGTTPPSVSTGENLYIAAAVLTQTDSTGNFAGGGWTLYQASGPQGIQGIQGTQGTQGIQGAQGSQGIQGNSGDILKTLFLYDSSTNTPSSIASGAGFNTSTGAAANTGTWTTSVPSVGSGEKLYVANAVVIQTQATGNFSGTGWAIYRVQGDQGSQGIQGIQGIQGPSGSSGGSIKEACKNVSGGALTIGTPVYQSGTVGSSSVLEVQAVTGSGSNMPAIGILSSTLANNAVGTVTILGLIAGDSTDAALNLNTSSFSEGDTLFIGASGGLTSTKPTGEANKLQNIAKVVKVNSSAGSLIVTGAGRVNATPNLNNGKFFLGNGSNQSATATFLTEVTGAMAPTITATLATAESVSLALSIALG